MKILAVETKYFLPNSKKIKTSAVDWYRVISPLKNLQKKVDWQIDFRKGIGVEEGMSEYEVERVWDEVGRNYDIFFSSYYHNPIAYSFLNVLSKRYGIKFVYDLDDDITSVNQYNPVYDTIQKEKINYLVILKDTPFITTTNSYLKKKLKRLRDKKNDFIEVLPNYIDLDVYVPAKHIEDDVITIVYMGGSSHAGDILFTDFHSAICYLLGKYEKKIKFQIVGFLPSVLEKVPGVEKIEGQSDFYDWIELYKKLSPFWDIGVAPLEDIEFNWSKSPIKVMEYGASFVPTVASPIGPYLSIIQDKKNGFFAYNVKDWIEAISFLIENKEARLKMGETIHNEVKTKWNIKNHLDRIKEVFLKIYNENTICQQTT